MNFANGIASAVVTGKSQSFFGLVHLAIVGN